MYLTRFLLQVTAFTFLGGVTVILGYPVLRSIFTNVPEWKLTLSLILIGITIVFVCRNQHRIIQQEQEYGRRKQEKQTAGHRGTRRP